MIAPDALLMLCLSWRQLYHIVIAACISYFCHILLNSSCISERLIQKLYPLVRVVSIEYHLFSIDN